MKRKHKRLLGIIALFVGVSLVMLFALYSLEENISFFYTPTELLSKANINTEVRIGGLVVPGTAFTLDNGSTHFVLADEKNKINVIYEGKLPPLFAENKEAVIYGTLVESGFFVANEVLAKHDERYYPK